MMEIGAFEAKTQFSRLLERARKGEEFTITHRGVAVAKLGPLKTPPDADRARAALARLRARTGEILGAPISLGEILDWRDAGRR